MVVERYTLKNGIPAFIVENHAAKVCSIQVWVKRGSAYEKEPIAGISHFLEHAIFKGSKNFGVGEIAKQLEELGGEVNAYTSFDETVYYTTLASRYFEKGVEILADAVGFPLFDSEEMEREKEVILEEIKRAYDSPHRMVSMNLWKMAFEKSPYGRPVLGFPETVSKISSSLLREYYREHYHSGTMAVVIVGDVDSKHTKQIAEKHFGKIKRGKREKALPQMRFQPLKKSHVSVLAKEVQECQVQIGFRAFPITHASIPPLDLASGAICQGESSPLYQYLVKNEGIALDVHAGLVATDRCGIFALGMTVAPEFLEKAITTAIEWMRKTVQTGTANTHFDRVKNSLESDVVAGKETVEGYARRLGSYFLHFGDPTFEQKYLTQILAVNPEEALDQLHQVLMNPPVISVVHPKNVVLSELTILGKKFPKEKGIKSSPSEKIATATKVTSSPYRLILKSTTHLPVVSARFVFQGGNREESNDLLGIFTLLQRVWVSGTPTYRSLDLAHLLESMGASIYGFSGRNTFGLSVECLTKHWGALRSILSEVLKKPTFSDEEFAHEKKLLLREIMSERDSPGQICHLNFIRALYGSHPYGRSTLGTLESINRIQPHHLRDIFTRFATLENLVISVVGDVGAADLGPEMERLCEGIPLRGQTVSKLPKLIPSKSFTLIEETKADLNQSHLMVGFLGVDCRNPNRYALKLLSSCLAGQGGRLFIELRDKQSLAYTVSPMMVDSPDGGMFAFYIGCSPEKVEAALVGIRKEIERVISEPVSNRELDRAKRYWIGRYELDQQRYGAQAMGFALDETYGLGFDHWEKVVDQIQSVTAAEIQAQAGKLFQIQSPILSIVHPTGIPEGKLEKTWMC